MAHIRQKNGFWYVCFKDPASGKQTSRPCGQGKSGEATARKLRKQIESQITLGTFESKTERMPWLKFRLLYEQRRFNDLRPASRSLIERAIGNFERIVRPGFIDSITTDHIEDFRAKRIKEKRHGKPITKETVNRDLRGLKSVLRAAHAWKLLPEVPMIRFFDTPQRQKAFVELEHFDRILAHVDAAHRPGPNVAGIETADWWRAFLAWIMLSGWRVQQVLDLQWKDLDLSTRQVFATAEQTKGDRDVLAVIHPNLVPLLTAIKQDRHPHVFPRNRSNRVLQTAFEKIQDAAGDDVRRRRSGMYYSFHDLRRAFATYNARDLNLFELKGLMQHQSLTTTELYAAMAQQQLDYGNQKVRVPESLCDDPDGTLRQQRQLSLLADQLRTLSADDLRHLLSQVKREE